MSVFGMSEIVPGVESLSFSLASSKKESIQHKKIPLPPKKSPQLSGREGAPSDTVPDEPVFHRNGNDRYGGAREKNIYHGHKLADTGHF